MGVGSGARAAVAAVIRRREAGGREYLGSHARQPGNGACYPTGLFDISRNMAGKQLVRLGFWYQASNAGLKIVRVMGRWEIKKC